MPEHENAFVVVQGGQNSASLANRLPDNQFARGVNVSLENQIPTTRTAIRVVPLTGNAAAFLSEANIQGALFYNPAEGQGAVPFGSDESSLIVTAGGRKLQIKFTGSGTSTEAVVTDISNNLVSAPDLHLSYLNQWENYVLAGDGSGNTWIWDGINPAFTSSGYNNVDKEKSRVPNGGTVMVYAHGRGCVVVNGRAVLASDNLNRINQTSAEDVLKFVEQVYWATGQYFSPPSRMGKINAAAVLALQDTNHGHGEVMFHQDGGIFSVDLNIFPRSKWSESPLVKTVYSGSGAAGPYAVASMDGDQLFRSLTGVQTLRSARAEPERTGNPRKPISDSVKTFLANDDARYLRFASVETWQTSRRGFVTCYPVVQGRYRWHRGFIVMNFDPVPEEITPPVWEGLWTLPPKAKGVIQFVTGRWNSENRMFAFVRGDDGLNRLVEFRQDLTDDVLQDGTTQRIRCQLQTRAMDSQRPFTKKEFQTGTLFLRNIIGDIEWGVWVRARGAKKWVFWRGGSVKGCPTCAGDELPAEPTPGDIDIPLGNVPDDCGGSRTTRYMQFLIRWAGRCSVEGLRIAVGAQRTDEDKFEPHLLKVEFKDCEPGCLTYDDYEYSDDNESDSWLTKLTSP